MRRKFSGSAAVTNLRPPSHTPAPSSGTHSDGCNECVGRYDARVTQHWQVPADRWRTDKISWWRETPCAGRFCAVRNRATGKPPTAAALARPDTTPVHRYVPAVPTLLRRLQPLNKAAHMIRIQAETINRSKSVSSELSRAMDIWHADCRAGQQPAKQRPVHVFQCRWCLTCRRSNFQQHDHRHEIERVGYKCRCRQ